MKKQNIIKLISPLVLLTIVLSGCTSIKTAVLGTPDDLTYIDPKYIYDRLFYVVGYLKIGAYILAAIFFVYGGVMYISSFGDREKIEKAKKTLLWSIIGAVIVLLADLVLQYALSLVMGGTVIQYNP